MTEKDIVDAYIEEAKEKITQDVRDIVSKLEKGEKPYRQFTMDYKYMMQLIKEIHGSKEVKAIKQEIDGVKQ